MAANGSSDHQPSSVNSASMKQVATNHSLNRKESYKAQRQSYAKEKKRVERELLSTFKDQSIIVLADWLKVRGSLKSWTKLWCVLKPGLLLLYKSSKTKSSHWIGTIILSTCELIERPSKKDGFCLKLFHPMDQSIWAARGPEGETIGAVVQPLPTSHLIFRTPNNAAGKCWMDALELALRCSSLLLRTMNSGVASHPSTDCANTQGLSVHLASGCDNCQSADEKTSGRIGHAMRDSLNESDVEKHFISELEGDSTMPDPEDEDDEEEYPSPDSIIAGGGMMDIESSLDGPVWRLKSGDDLDGRDEECGQEEMIMTPRDVTVYAPDDKGEVFGEDGDQTEEFSDENKSIVWFLMKQVRPGMDLSKVVLPTFILEPRSFLDKISDYYYHADILTDAIKDDSPFSRMKTVVRWYLSGFYKKPKGLKKPYNPILGERFRCYWQHPNGSKTHYISEQVSHHPPISAFYVTNRQEGFTISASILAKSRFYGNSISAILDGVATLNLLPRGEDYKLTMPYAHCKGILMGTMTMELGGKITIVCDKTGYSAELEFKLRPFLGGGEFTNAVSGKIKLGKEVLVTLDGKWDDVISMKDNKTGVEEILWKVNSEVRSRRLPRFTVPMESQEEFESVKLWRKVSAAIERDDQLAATEEKYVLEEAQREAARERKAAGTVWCPNYFEIDPTTHQYVYKHSDLRPWDPLNDLYTYERNYILCTKTKHKTPTVRTQSIVSISGGVPGREVGRLPMKPSSSVNETPLENGVSCVGTPPPSGGCTPKKLPIDGHGSSGDDGDGTSCDCRHLNDEVFREQNMNLENRLNRLQMTLEQMIRNQHERESNSNINRDMVLLVILVVMIQAVLNWVLSTRAQQIALGGGNGDIVNGGSPSFL